MAVYSLSRPDIWDAICKVSFDVGGVDFPFSDRLARDNGWHPAFGRRVIEEYRRFAYLAVASGREVTPSDEVDQAWHLHLCYTRHYWGEWQDALGKPLHHGPTAGGESEGLRYEDNYTATRELYRSEFGEAPPQDIWPSSQERFRDPARFKRLDTSRYIIVNRLNRAWIAVIAFLMVLIGGHGFAAAHTNRDPGFSGWVMHQLDVHTLNAVLVGGVVLYLIGFAVYRLFLEPDWAKHKRKNRRDDRRGDGGSGCGSGGCSSGCSGCGGD
ncbi:MAG: hypothetical protein AAF441_17925 [Pseudomonadota bacterium]